jgi:hypothetical protein
MLACAEQPVLQHLIHDVGLPRLRPGHAGDGVDALRLLDDAGEHRRLGDAQREACLPK